MARLSIYLTYNSAVEEFIELLDEKGIIAYLEFDGSITVDEKDYARTMILAEFYGLI